MIVSMNIMAELMKHEMEFTSIWHSHPRDTVIQEDQLKGLGFTLFYAES